jgi:transcriptional regulator with XRE-family HTH domain
VGVDASTVTVWEKSSRLPSDERLAEVAHFLGVSPAWIRYGLDSEAPRAGLLAALIDPATARLMTEADLDRAEAQVAAKAKRPTRGKKPNGG